MDTEEHKAEKQRGSAEAGLVYFGAILTGFIGIIASATAFFNAEIEGRSLYLLASAVVFGLLANAMYRN
ncbi:hypothetical protein [Gimesia sp.]|uniref:hypothetical protein n=1 Tax=Gimesia sp. TaxID=2024833 RepID=UPI000C5EE851|nr:hypothetical protein [Gimesia sp.]MAX39478.1 hypothetical protein [Gimesia sp.]HAH47252.1 hypothetical protein [Planctomycetaceae bacterium]HBL46281.1 hypothetical protein [Planctomycetaceae bacterium]|tara:strand:+ start:204 stop:410 length:207 start_codon:yes stop_codon:yes gene_type:complete